MYIPIKKNFITMEMVYLSNMSRDEKVFLINYFKNLGYSFFDAVSISQALTAAADKKYLTDWLLERKHIELVFEPYEIKIKIKTKLDYWKLWHRLNIPFQYFEGYIKTFYHGIHDEKMVGKALGGAVADTLWNQVNEQHPKT